MLNVLKRSIIFLFTSVLAGAVTGFILTLFIYLFSFWWDMRLKIIILLILTLLYSLHEFSLIRLKIPQNKWQIPVTWVNNKSDLKNMTVWGSILGSGLFTYIPHSTFYLLYIYVGILGTPIWGLVFGVVYAMARTLTNIILSFFNIDQSNPVLDCNLRIKNISQIINGLVLLVLVSYLILNSKQFFYL